VTLDAAFEISCPETLERFFLLKSKASEGLRAGNAIEVGIEVS
jgi:hypothetical protein